MFVYLLDNESVVSIKKREIVILSITLLEEVTLSILFSDTNKLEFRVISEKSKIKGID